MFISEADVKSVLEGELGRAVKACPVENIRLRQLEAALQKDNWVSKAQVFIDNKRMLHVAISERLPVARIFTQGNRSYYIDSGAVILPLSQQQLADVPVFTNMPDRTNKLVGADSLFWQQIGKMGSYIINDSFLLMQVGQVDVIEGNELALYPVVGNHVVLMGTPDNYAQKLSRLKKFDQQVLAKAGLNKYSRLDLRYEKQVVATLRGRETLPTPALHIAPETEAVLSPSPPEAVPAPTETTVKAEAKALEKKPAIQLINPPKKEDKTAKVARAEKRKPDLKPQQNKVAALKKRQAENDRKISASSNNKPTKKALEQLPKKRDKPGLIEVDIRQKPADHQPRALMPKKQ
jgi:cell division protein FtsQ